MNFVYLLETGRETGEKQKQVKNMLLSIDRVLQLLAEGKSLEKIASLATCEVDDVTAIIEQARTILAKYEKQNSRKKIILKKKNPARGEAPAEDDETSRIFAGAELSAVPVDSVLTMYIAGYSPQGEKNGGFGITVHDREDRQVGKVSYYCGNCSETLALYRAVLRALQIGNYFNSKKIKIRNDNETFLKQASGDIHVEDPLLNKIIDEIKIEMSGKARCLFETVSKVPVDKARFLAEKAVAARKGH